MMIVNPVKRAIDTNLSSLRVTDRSAAAILRSAREGKKVKRKLSVAFIITLMVLLLAAGAIAAVLLSSKEFVDQVMAPIAQEDPSTEWTEAQTEEIFKLAEENGIGITDDIRKRFKKTDSVDKEELMRAFAKIELGFYPATWSLEDQAWYDELLVRCGLREERTRFLPEGDEITEVQAISIAIEYIHSHFSSDAEVTDESAYTRYLQYMLSVDPDGGQKKIWDIEYEAVAKDTPSYGVVLLPNGEVLPDESYTIIEAGWRDEWYNTYMADDFWTVEGMYRFKQEWGPKVKQLEASGVNIDSPDLLYLVGKNYGLPSKEDISRDDAYQIARNAILCRDGWTEEKLNLFGTREAYRIDDPDCPVYDFVFTYWAYGIADARRQEAEALFHEGKIPHNVIVLVAAKTGEVVEIREESSLDGTNRLGM